VKGGPASVVLVRVDNRLVHGQVLEAWLPALDAHGIVVADDEAAGNVLARSAMALAIPPRVKFECLRMDAAAEALKPGGRGPPSPRTLVLLRDVRDALALYEKGVALPQLNIGNVHFAAGRQQVSPSVFLDAGEVRMLSQLAGQGTHVEIRAVPSDAPMTLDAIRAKF
jgi:mannose/fructose/N-acetylgalactosamine-specific phosphotransferase system component IIB